MLLTDAREFCAPATARDFAALGARHRQHFDGHFQTYFTPDSYRLWRDAADFTAESWRLLDAAHNAEYWYAGRRETRLDALRDLRILIGPAAYDGRRMPPPTPSWLR